VTVARLVAEACETLAAVVCVCMTVAGSVVLIPIAGVRKENYDMNIMCVLSGFDAVRTGLRAAVARCVIDECKYRLALLSIHLPGWLAGLMAGETVA
jgi:hypothetical protein